MTKHKVDCINLAFVTNQFFVLSNTVEDYDNDMMENKEVCICVSFILDEQLGRSSKAKPQIANLDQLKILFVNWIKNNRPDACWPHLPAPLLKKRGIK